jgi:hypothetical protein
MVNRSTWSDEERRARTELRSLLTPKRPFILVLGKCGLIVSILIATMILAESRESIVKVFNQADNFAQGIVKDTRRFGWRLVRKIRPCPPDSNGWPTYAVGGRSECRSCPTEYPWKRKKSRRVSVIPEQRGPWMPHDCLFLYPIPIAKRSAFYD